MTVDELLDNIWNKYVPNNQLYGTIVESRPTLLAYTYAQEIELKKLYPWVAIVRVPQQYKEGIYELSKI